MATNLSGYRRPAPALVDHRDAPRETVLVTRASVRRHGEPALAATLLNISGYGCRLAAAEELRVGERLWLRFDGRLPIAAVAVWSRDGEHGCRFDAALDRAAVRALTLAC